jgi:branched-chain amino acid transport system ATP-binding protein
MFLQVKDISVFYGQSQSISNISLNINEGEIVSVVGANGAGKTTLLKTITGLLKPSAGEIWFKGKRIDGMQPYNITKMGIALVPAGREIFSHMSVLDNLKVGAYLRKDSKKVNRDLELIYTHFPVLKEKQKQMGGKLSGGQQQMLAVARALMANPSLLLMDEPSIGLSPILVAEVGKIIGDINQRGISIILIEQNCRLALKISNRSYIVELGKVTISGNSKELINNEFVKRSYLGG